MRADGKNLSLVFGSVEVACVSTSVVLDNEDAPPDLVTFQDVTDGTDVRWFFQIGGYPDYGNGTFWAALWSVPLFEPFAYLFKPYGNDDPTPEQPHFAGTVTVVRRPPIGGEASRAWTWDTRLDCTTAPERRVA